MEEQEESVITSEMYGAASEEVAVYLKKCVKDGSLIHGEQLRETFVPGTPYTYAALMYMGACGEVSFLCDKNDVKAFSYIANNPMMITQWPKFNYYQYCNAALSFNETKVSPGVIGFGLAFMKNNEVIPVTFIRILQMMDGYIPTYFAIDPLGIERYNDVRFYFGVSVSPGSSAQDSIIQQFLVHKNNNVLNMYAMTEAAMKKWVGFFGFY